MIAVHRQKLIPGLAIPLTGALVAASVAFRTRDPIKFVLPIFGNTVEKANQKRIAESNEAWTEIFKFINENYYHDKEHTYVMLTTKIYGNRSVIFVEIEDPQEVSKDEKLRIQTKV